MDIQTPSVGLFEPILPNSNLKGIKGQKIELYAVQDSGPFQNDEIFDEFLANVDENIVIFYRTEIQEPASELAETYETQNDIDLNQSKIRRKKWDSHHIEFLQNLKKEFRQTHPCVTGISEVGWNMIVEEMKNQFPGENFNVETCKKASRTRQIKQVLETSTPCRIRNGKLIQQNAENASKWNEKHLKSLKIAFEMIRYTHLDKVKGVSLEGWKLIAKKMELDFPGEKFSHQSCKKIHSIISTYFDENSVDRVHSSQIVPKKNTPDYHVRYNSEHLNHLKKLINEYSIYQSSRTGLTMQGWEFVASEMEKLYPEEEHIAYTCMYTYFLCLKS